MNNNMKHVILTNNRVDEKEREEIKRRRIRAFDEAKEDQRRLAIDGDFSPFCQTTIHYATDNEDSGTLFHGSVTFSTGNMLTYTRELVIEAPAGTVAILNMANRKKPGGGYKANCAAQEEQLCRTTGLFPYLDHAAKGGAYPIQSGKALCCWHVPVVRDENDLKRRLSFPYSRLHVVSVAARRYMSEEEANADENLVSDLCRTWTAAFKAADECGAHEFVVSALGCGAFRNPPERVAEAFSLALKGCVLRRGCLKKISVVVMDDHNSRDNVARFRAELEARGVLTKEGNEEDEEEVVAMADEGMADGPSPRKRPRL